MLDAAGVAQLGTAALTLRSAPVGNGEPTGSSGTREREWYQDAGVVSHLENPVDSYLKHDEPA